MALTFSIISDRARRSVPPLLSLPILSSFILTFQPVLNVHLLFPLVPIHCLHWHIMPFPELVCVALLRRRLAVFVLNSLFGFHLFNRMENWITFSFFVVKNEAHPLTSHAHWHKHSLSSKGWKMDHCLSGETSPGKCFSSQKSPGYHCNLRVLCLRRGEDVITLPNDQPLGALHHFVI